MCFGTRQFGTLYGCYYFVSLAIFTVAPVVTGHVYDVTHSYFLAFVAAGLGALVGLIILAFAPLQNLGEALYAGSTPQRSAAR